MNHAYCCPSHHRRRDCLVTDRLLEFEGVTYTQVRSVALLKAGAAIGKGTAEPGFDSDRSKATPSWEVQLIPGVPTRQTVAVIDSNSEGGVVYIAQGDELTTADPDLLQVLEGER